MKKLLLSAVSVCLLLACSSHYSEGSRVGVVTKLSKKGTFWKSWEGEVLLSGTDADERGVLRDRYFYFSVELDQGEVVTQLQQAMRDGKKVEVIYRESTIPSCQYQSTYRIEGVNFDVQARQRM